MTRTIARRIGLITVPVLAAGILLAVPMAASAYGPAGDILEGTSWREVVFDADGSEAWVTSQSSGTISRVDVETSTEIIEIPVGTEPTGATVSPDGSEVWVAVWGSASETDITIVNTVDNTTTQISSGGNGPYEIVFDAAGDYAYVSNYFTGQITKIDTDTRAVVDSELVNGSPEGLALSADGNALYVTLTAYDTVIRLNADSLAPIGDPISVGDFPVKVVLSPDGSDLWVANNGGGSLSVIDVATHLVVDTVTVGGFALGLSFDVDGFLWATFPNFTVVRIDPVSHEVVSTQTSPFAVRGITAHPTERLLYLATSGNVTVLGLFPTRISGADRFATAVEISEAAFPVPAEVSTVYVATGLKYPDALAAGPVAAKVNAPVLLTRPDVLPPVVAGELARLDPDNIVLLGDSNSVSASVQSALNAIAPTERISGADRFATGRALVASEFGAGSADEVYLANGLNFPDALSGGGAAASGDDPVILVNGSASSLDTATLTLIDSINPSKVHILGSTNSISAGIAGQLDSLGYDVGRFAGSNRYETSVLVNDDAFAQAEYVVFTTGLKFPDALAGTPFAKEYDAPVYLVRPNCVPSATLSELDRLDTAWVVILGGPDTVSVAVEDLVACP